MTDYVMTHRKRDWVPEWLWRLASAGSIVARVGFLRRALAEPVPYEQHGSWWMDLP